MPIIIDGIHYGNFFTGQFFLEEPNLEFFRDQAQKYGFDEGAYTEAIKKVPVWTQEQVDNYLFYIEGLICVISESGLKRVKEIESRKQIQKSEKKYRSILRAALDGYWLTDTRGRLLEVNEAYCRMSGYSETELLGMNISDFEVVEAPKIIAEHMQKVLLKGSDRFESKHRRKDGTIFDVEVSVQIHREEGERCVCFVRDITDRKQVEEALKESKIFLENMTDVAYMADDQGNLLWVNPAVERVTGFPPEDIIGRPFLPLFIEADHTSLIDVYKRTLAGESLENTLTFKSGVTSHFTSLPKHNSKGDIIGTFGVARDITESKKTERALLESQKRLSESNQILQAVLEHTHMMAVLLDPQFHFIWVNRAYADACRHDPSFFPGKNHFDLYPHEENKTIFQRVVDTGESFLVAAKPFEFPDQPERGVTYWDWSLIPVLSESGEVLSLVFTLVDVTEKIKADAALRESEGKFRLTFDASPDAVNINRLHDGLYIDINKGFTQLTGFTRDDVIGQTSCDIQIWNDPNDRRRLVHELKEKGFCENLEAKFRRKDGSITTALMSANIISLKGEQHIISITRDISERINAEAAIKENEAKFRNLFELSPLPVALTEIESGTFVDVNEKLCELTLYTKDEILGNSTTGMDFYAEKDRDRFLKELKTAGQVNGMEMQFKLKDGTMLTVLMFSQVLKVTGKPIILSIFNDITEQKRMEKQIRQSQKIESIGNLAGGVAHDFNNMLSVIIGNTEMALDQAGSPQTLHDNLLEIHKAAMRSANVVRQLLAFARKQTIAPRVMDLNETVEEMLKMLRRLIGENIDLSWQPGHDIWPVKMDPAQIDQILANLSVNARDAIEGVGRLTIETGRATFDEAYCAQHPGFVPGDFILLAVSDNGCGMDKETLENIFEPFFTTKEVGKGTGLGLATIYGIAKQNNGFINVYSEPDRGTTFKIYLPRHRTVDEPIRQERADAGETHGNETILLVEDETTILKMARMMLERLGYTVLTAGTPGEAMDVAREHSEEINLLMTDVVMPEMNGRDLAGKLISLYPDLKWLFMSGYTENAIAHHGVLDEGVNFIQKPFSKQELSVKVRKVLDEK